MTLFEYLSVAVSIVLALGIGKLVASVPAVFAPDRRDWLHASFVVLVGIAHLLLWWRFWALREVPSWNFLQFVIVIGTPITMYFGAHVLVSEPPGGATSWRQRFAETHRWFFGAFGVSLVFGVLRVSVVQEGGFRPLPAALIAMVAIGGALTSDRRVHIFVGVLAWLLIAVLVQSSFMAGSY